MKRQEFIKHLRKHKCYFKKHGGKHDIYENEINGKWSTVPRHPTIKKFLCYKICKDLDIPRP